MPQDRDPLPMPFYTAAGYKKLILTSEPAGRPLPKKHWSILLGSLNDYHGVTRPIIVQALSVIEEVATHRNTLGQIDTRLLIQKPPQKQVNSLKQIPARLIDYQILHPKS